MKHFNTFYSMILGDLKLDIDNNKILICNCENSMEIDGDSITKACQSKTKCDVNNNLCGSEINIVLEQLEQSKKNNKNLFITCTQEQQTFWSPENLLNSLIFTETSLIQNR